MRSLPSHTPFATHIFRRPFLAYFTAAMFRVSALSPGAVLRSVGSSAKRNSTITKIIDNHAVGRNPMFQVRRGSSAPSPNSISIQEESAAIAGSYFDDPMNVRYHVQVWGEGIHIGRYDLLKGEDAKLEGVARVKRATSLTREVVINKLFPEHLGPSDGLTVLEMGSGFGTLARDVAQKKRCKVVCIEVSGGFNAINAARSVEAGVAGNIIIPGERSIFDTGMPTASMDRLMSTDCFAHAHGDTDSIMKEAARVLKRGSLMVFTTLMQPDTADASALAKVHQEIGITRLVSPEAFKESGKEYGMELVEYEDQSPNLIIHYGNLVDRINSVRGHLEDVDDSMLDARSDRCNLFVNAGQRGLLIWGTTVFRKDVD